MCAIFGIVGPYDEKAARRAFSTFAHRGPDGSGIVAEPGLFLAHHRLAVIDPLPEADQPMRVGGTTVLFNGEIYNYRELREKLGSRFGTRSDTEVLGRAFLAWGEKMPERLRGMYAAAFWRDGVLHLFRDPFGKKPLYYAKIGETFLFASEIKAIRSMFPQIRWSRDRIPSYLSYQSFISPYTFFPQISQLEPGGYLRYEKGEIDVTVEEVLPVDPGSGSIGFDRLEALIDESVRYRLVSDAPLGALLSGGIDSSLVAAMAQRRLAKPLPTFTVGYKGYEKYDERRYAEMVAKRIGSDHHAYEMGMEDFLSCADALAAHLDEPLGDPAAVPLWFLSRKIQKAGVKVVLSGDGADELFFGYRPYYEMADIERARDLKFKNWLRNYFRAHYSPNREWEWYKRIFDDSVLFRSSAELFTDLQQNRLLKQNVKDDRSLTWIAHYIERFGDAVGSQWYSYIDIKVQLGEVFLKKLDRVSMAHGIEARSPFMDRMLVKALFSCDPAWRMGERPKWLLKEVAKRYLPNEIVERRKKGFSYPFIEWLHASGELAVIDRVNAMMKLFDDSSLRFMVEKSKKGRFKHHLYAVWFLCKWLEKRL
ncbi:asparagine synthase (glutamine-hydrolyzing) [Hydrogenimonas cancrithermarum]|uniref:asparagine synthase (glutamine-hydrolyzing) n=1 Tax=Hydrogenimonas cancrithermarum TaxID=2993563 RepID=A0ABN6WV24_9BACT|nr:asparagine synthase (glutamine-hydrolyzing) [Hydrogenimonas cancrithermarum]BDY12848.1 asparagine synthetase B [Hydrogenimonas cancrithermarum]BDY12965.1 asparagine synthetase B [Hydrogenimonas cancrithermarum]